MIASSNENRIFIVSLHTVTSWTTSSFFTCCSATLRMSMRSSHLTSARVLKLQWRFVVVLKLKLCNQTHHYLPGCTSGHAAMQMDVSELDVSSREG